MRCIELCVAYFPPIRQENNIRQDNTVINNSNFSKRNFPCHVTGAALWWQPLIELPCAECSTVKTSTRMCNPSNKIILDHLLVDVASFLPSCRYLSIDSRLSLTDFSCTVLLLCTCPIMTCPCITALQFLSSSTSLRLYYLSRFDCNIFPMSLIDRFNSQEPKTTRRGRAQWT